MATDVLTAEPRLSQHHQLLLHQFDQHAAEQRQQALAVLDDEVDDECVAALQQQLTLQHSKLQQRLNVIKHHKLLAVPTPPQPHSPASPIAPHSSSSPTSHLYLSQQILQLLDAATQLLGDKRTAIHTLVNLISQQTPSTDAPPTPIAQTRVTSSSQPSAVQLERSQLLTIDLWKARDVDASPAESPSSTRAQPSSTRVSTAPSSPSPLASPLDSPVRSASSPSQSPAASPAFVHPSLLSSPMYRPAERPLPPSPHPPTPDRPVNIRARKSFSYAASPLQSPEPMAEPRRTTIQSPLTVERLEEQSRSEQQEAADRRDTLRHQYEQHAAAEQRRVEWMSDLNDEFKQTVSEPSQDAEAATPQQQPIDVILSRSALSSSTTSNSLRRQLRPSNVATAASTGRAVKQKRPASSSIKSIATSSSTRAAHTFSVPTPYAHRTTHSAASSLSASLTERKQQLRQQREQAAIAASQHNMARAYDLQASVKSASMKRREEEEDRRRRLEAERSRAQEEERKRAHAAHLRRMRQEEEEKRRRREERDRQRDAMSASAQLRERQRLRDERRRREQEEEEAEQQAQQHYRSSRSFDSHRLERLLRDVSMTRSASSGRREAALRELAERSVHEGEVEREERRRVVHDEDWTERMLREMMKEYQLDPGRTMHSR